MKCGVLVGSACLSVVLTACSGLVDDGGSTSAADDWVSASEAPGGGTQDTGSSNEGGGNGGGGDGPGGGDGGDGCTEYGPDNGWFHACEEDMPANLSGFGLSQGQTAMNFTMVDQNGDFVELYQFYGQVVVLDLFASW